MNSYRLVRATLSQYRAQFREFFPPLFVACALGYPAYVVLSSAEQSLTRPAYSLVFQPAPLFSASHPLVRMLLHVLFRFAESFVCWLTFVVCLAAAAGKVLGERTDDSAHIRLIVALQKVWPHRWGALVIISFLLSCVTALFYAFLLPSLLGSFLDLLYYAGVPISSLYIAAPFASATIMVLLCAMLAKLALGVTEMADDLHIPAAQALRNSLAATLRWEWVFAVVFSLIAASGYAVNSFADYVFHNSTQYEQLNALGREMIQGALCTLVIASGLMLVTIMFCNLYVMLRYSQAAAAPQVLASSNSESM